jgi:hypothetical protein
MPTSNRVSCEVRIRPVSLSAGQRGREPHHSAQHQWTDPL